MHNHSDEILLTLLQMSREIITLIQNKATAEVIIEKMDEREKLVAELETSPDQITNSDVMLELLRLRNDEKILLKPFIDELHTVRQELINLKQARTYQTIE